MLAVDVVQQQFNVQGTFRLAWLCDATDAKRFEKDPKTFIPSWIPSISWSNKVAFNATPLAQDHGGLYSVESRASDKATVIYQGCDFDGVRTNLLSSDPPSRMVSNMGMAAGVFGEF